MPLKQTLTQGFIIFCLGGLFFGETCYNIYIYIYVCIYIYIQIEREREREREDYDEFECVVS